MIEPAPPKKVESSNLVFEVGFALGAGKIRNIVLDLNAIQHIHLPESVDRNDIRAKVADLLVRRALARDNALDLPKQIAAPPASAEWLLTLLLKRHRVDALLGDLEELFHRDCGARGDRRARWLYWARVLRSVAPLLWSAIKKAGIFAAVADVARRYLSG